MKLTPHKWLFIIVSLASYIIFASFHHLLMFEGSRIISIWLPTGISMYILLAKGYKYLPLVFIGNFLISFIISFNDNNTPFNTLTSILLLSFVNTLSVLYGAYLIFRISKSHLKLSSLNSVIRYIFITIFITFILALFGTFLHCYFNNDWHIYFSLFINWWIGNALSLLLVTPLLLSFPKKLFPPQKKLKILEFILYVFVIFIFIILIKSTLYPIKFLIFPILIISLFRFGKLITFTSLFIFALLIGIQNLEHPLTGDYIQNKDILIYQLYFSVASILLLIVSSLLENQKIKEAELVKSKTRFQSIFNSINEAILICDKNSGAILDVNNHACEWLGYTHVEFKKMPISDIYSNKHPVTKKNAAKFFEKSLTSSQNFHCEINDKTNKTYYCSIQLTKAQVFENDNIIATIRDDSEKYRLEKEITHSYIEAQEEEKQYFGEEIHDTILQTLAAEQIFIEAIDKLDNHSNSKITNHLKKLNELNLKAIDAIQQIAYGLMSKHIKEQGLILSLENLFIDMGASSKVEFNFTHKNIQEKDISDIIKLNAFRIVQELSNNCINYSNSTLVYLKINKTYLNTLEIVFSENDKNLNIEYLQNINSGRDMKNINRRLKYLNGDFSVNSESKIGFEMIITIPLS